MEAIVLESLFVEFGVAFFGLVALLFVATGIFLAGLAEEEMRGDRYTWAEWPLPETAETPHVRIEERLAA